ncbi:hypothetical protein Tco_1551134 [Tanacetum coccineum]
MDEYNKCLELKSEFSKKNEMLKESLRSNKPCQNHNAPAFKEFFKINNLKAQLKGKDTIINNLKKHIANLKEKVIDDCGAPVSNSRVISPVMYKLDLIPISPTFRKNKEVHEDYLKVTKEHVDILRGIIVQDRALEPFDNALDYALISSTSASGSKSKSNTRKNRITQEASSNQKNNKVEDHPRSVMSSSNKKNRVSICNACTKHAVLDADSKFVCFTCNDCLFSTDHDKFVVDYLNDVNSRVKSKSGKSIKKE